MAHTESDHRGILRNLLIVLVGQVGCITLVVVLVSVRVGLWLDAYFQTRPLYTLVFLFAGIPISILLMLVVARRTLARLMKEKESGREDPSEAEV
jgi:F0F1-type ATP synthase assembly protein I